MDGLVLEIENWKVVNIRGVLNEMPPVKMGPRLLSRCNNLFS